MNVFVQYWQPRDVRALRFAVGMTLTVVLAFTIAWPISFLTALLTGKILSSPKNFLSLKEGLGVFLVISVSMIGSFLFASALINYPMVFMVLDTWILLQVFYAGRRGASPILVIMMLVAFTVVPLLAMQSKVVAFEAVKGLVLASGLSIVFAWLAFALVPGGEQGSTPKKQLGQADSDHFESAVKSTIVVLPLFIYIYLTSNINGMIILVFVAILSQETDFQAGVKSGFGLVLGNLIGGLIGIAVYNLLVAVPSLLFFVLLMALVWLSLSRLVMADGAKGALFGIAYTTILVILNGAFGFATTDAGNTLVVRLLQLMMVAVYITMAFSVIDVFWSWLKIGGIKRVRSVS
jgi:hypothetical protein